MAEITLAQKAGFCFGVDRAIKLIEKLASEGRKVATLGPIIHNGQVIGDLAKRGVKVVESPSEVEPDAILVLRTHGVTQEVLKEVEESGCEFIDAACPFVKKIHKIVLDNSSEEVVTLIAGDENVEAAALASGFSDAKYFARVVKRHFGCTPRQLKHYGNS